MSTKKFTTNNYGDPHEIFFVSGLINSTESIKGHELKEYCITIGRDIAYAFEGIIELLSSINWVIEHEDGYLTKDLTNFHLDKNISVFKEILVKEIFSSLIQEEILHYFIDLDSLDFDLKTGEILVNINSIPMEYSGLRKLFHSLGFFIEFDIHRIFYLISESYQSYFKSEILQWLNKKANFQAESGLSYKQFKEIQRLKEELGQLAEQQIVLFEKKRLTGHPLIERIEQISFIKVDAGYDIVSFDGLKSKSIDRFIEVKSYSGNEEFFWTINEIQVAEQKQEKYFLYLVDRDQLNLHDFKPIIIRNPYKNVYKNPSWQKSPTAWKFLKA